MARKFVPSLLTCISRDDVSRKRISVSREEGGAARKTDVFLNVGVSFSRIVDCGRLGYDLSTFRRNLSRPSSRRRFDLFMFEATICQTHS